MNEIYGQIFKLPEPRIQPATETVPGIDGQKMSKSYGNNIDIFGDEKEMRKRVMSIVTDSLAVDAPKDPATSTIKSWTACAKLWACASDLLIAASGRYFAMLR